jgi:hypothetical protein
LPLRKVLGPGVILLATALGSGEYVLWPFISAHLGLAILWAAIVAIAIQLFISMEVERYTLANGGDGDHRLHAPVEAVVGAVHRHGRRPEHPTRRHPRPHRRRDHAHRLAGRLQTVEKLQSVVIVAVIIWLVVAVIFGTTAEAWSDFVSGFGSFGSIKTNDAVTAAALAGAIAFAGSGGCGNLAVSNWVRDKGHGHGPLHPAQSSRR